MAKANPFMTTVKETSGINQFGSDATGYRIPGVGEFPTPARLFYRGAPINGFTLQLFANHMKLEIHENGEYQLSVMENGKISSEAVGNLHTITANTVTV